MFQIPLRVDTRVFTILRRYLDSFDTLLMYYMMPKRIIDAQMTVIFTQFFHCACVNSVNSVNFFVFCYCTYVVLKIVLIHM